MKDAFSEARAKRIDWIMAALQDPGASLYVGWDGKKKRYNRNRRVALVVENYVVIIRFDSKRSAQFVTAYLADSSHTLAKIKRSPRWTP